jgi:predicted amidohydrolase
VRAQENHVFIVTADRVGVEGGFRFRGESRICDVAGRVLAVAKDGEETIVADIDPAVADDNRLIVVAGEYELDRVGNRRPEHYGLITQRRTGASSGGLP